MKITLKKDFPKGFYEQIFKRYYRYLFGPIVITGDMNTKSVCLYVEYLRIGIDIL